MKASLPMRPQAAALIALQTLGVTLAMTLSACNNNEKAPASQLAARVNDAEISVHQINFLLGRSSPPLSQELVPRARREILEKLIDQQLVIEQTLDKKLDRTPELLMALEAGRREILARAYIDQIIASQAKPTVAEGKKYIADHPQLFAERHIFNIQEIVLPASNKVAPNLRDMLGSGKTMDEIAQWLKSKDIKFAGNSATRAAEQIPLDLLPNLQQLKDGQGMVLENDQTITVMRLVTSQMAPISAAVAMPRVQQFLGNQRASEAISTELKLLKAKAKITYQGEFTGEIPASTPSPAKSPNPAPVAPSAALKPNMEKGIAGIK